MAFIAFIVAADADHSFDSATQLIEQMQLVESWTDPQTEQRFVTFLDSSVLVLHPDMVYAYHIGEVIELPKFFRHIDLLV